MSRVAVRVIAGVVLVFMTAISANGGEWEGIRPGVTSFSQLRDRLGEPTSRYPDSAIFPGPRKPQPIRISTVVVYFRSGGIVDSFILFPEWGVTNEDIHEEMGKGQLMSYARFLKISGRQIRGAGDRPNTKLHYLTLDTQVEYFKKSRILVAYDERDLTSGEEVVKLMLYF